jgi:hypothetical protein
MHRLAARILAHRTLEAQPTRVIYVMRATHHRVIRFRVSSSALCRLLKVGSKLSIYNRKNAVNGLEEFKKSGAGYLSLFRKRVG